MLGAYPPRASGHDRGWHLNLPRNGVIVVFAFLAVVCIALHVGDANTWGVEHLWIALAIGFLALGSFRIPGR